MGWKKVDGFDYWLNVYGDIRNKRGKELLVSRRKNPHIMVGLYRDGKQHMRLLSVLMLETFVSPRPKGMVACHRNQNRHDNALSNLKWGTRGECYRRRNAWKKAKTGWNKLAIQGDKNPLPAGAFSPQ